MSSSLSLVGTPHNCVSVFATLSQSELLSDVFSLPLVLSPGKGRKEQMDQMDWMPIELTEEEKNLWARTTEVADLSQAHDVPCHCRVHTTVLRHIRHLSATRSRTQVVFFFNGCGGVMLQYVVSCERKKVHFICGWHEAVRPKCAEFGYLVLSRGSSWICWDCDMCLHHCVLQVILTRRKKKQNPPIWCWRFNFGTRAPNKPPEGDERTIETSQEYRNNQNNKHVHINHRPNIASAWLASPQW